MKKHIPEMDMTRVLATIAVVVIHTSLIPFSFGSPPGIGTFACAASYVMSRCAVPVFVVISVIGLQLSYKPDEGYFRFLWRRTKKIAVGYLLWTLIYSYMYYPPDSFGIRHDVTFMKLAINMITGMACYHLYFVPRIIELYAVYPLLRKITLSGKRVAGAFIVAGLLYIAVHTVDIPSSLAFLDTASGFIKWLPYIAAGFWLSYEKNMAFLKIERVNTVVSIVFYVWAACMVTTCYRLAVLHNDIDVVHKLMTILVVPYTLLAVAWVWGRDWSSRSAAWGNLVSKYSYSIYLSHPFILLIFFRWPGRTLVENHSRLGLAAPAFAFAFTASIILAAAGDKIRGRLLRA